MADYQHLKPVVLSLQAHAFRVVNQQIDAELLIVFLPQFDIAVQTSLHQFSKRTIPNCARMPISKMPSFPFPVLLYRRIKS